MNTTASPPTDSTSPADATHSVDSISLALGATSLLHLLQLASPGLPIGGFSYSQGLESAMQNGAVTDAGSARGWLIEILHQIMARFEAPLLWRLLHAWSISDAEAVVHWNSLLLCSRDTAEFRAETVQMGFSLGRLLAALEIVSPANQAILDSMPELALATSYACACVTLKVSPDAALLGMLFVWAENQVLVCVKSVPLGQVAGQRILLSLRPELEVAARTSMALIDDDLCNWTPGLSLLSMQHEVQYSRLYRS